MPATATPKPPHQAMLEAHELALNRAARISPLANSDWASAIPWEAGVYVVWQEGAPVYVGESSSLRLRMGDFGRPINHPFPKKVCAKFGLDESDHGRIAEVISSTYKLSYQAVPFGRAEVEEYLILRWRKTLANKPAERLLASSQYSWVNAA